MKGLLIKDLKLMMGQKNFFLMIIAMMLFMSFLFDDITFMIGFVSFVMSLFTLSTISYDEFDNGYAFLFTLPINKKMYAIEKYNLGLLLGCTSLVLATLLACAVSLIKGIMPIFDVMIAALMTLPSLLIIEAIMIPFQLKYGGEKGRIAIIIAVGIVFAIGAMLVNVSGMFGVDMTLFVSQLSTLSIGMLVCMLYLIAVVIFLVSMKISIIIMNKKEF